MQQQCEELFDSMSHLPSSSRVLKATQARRYEEAQRCKHCNYRPGAALCLRGIFGVFRSLL